MDGHPGPVQAFSLCGQIPAHGFPARFDQAQQNSSASGRSVSESEQAEPSGGHLLPFAALRNSPNHGS